MFVRPVTDRLLVADSGPLSDGGVLILCWLVVERQCLVCRHGQQLFFRVGSHVPMIDARRLDHWPSHLIGCQFDVEPDWIDVRP